MDYSRCLWLWDFTGDGEQTEASQQGTWSDNFLFAAPRVGTRFHSTSSARVENKYMEEMFLLLIIQLQIVLTVRCFHDCRWKVRVSFVQLTPGELVLRCHRSLHQLGFDQPGAESIRVFGIMLQEEWCLLISRKTLDDSGRIFNFTVQSQGCLEEHCVKLWASDMLVCSSLCTSNE